jgi:dimethylsulfone monooxygenase
MSRLRYEIRSERKINMEGRGKGASKMDFGVRLTIQGEMGAPGHGLAEYASNMAIRAEELGYDSAWIPDHLNNARLAPGEQGPSLECFTSVTAILMRTKKLVVGPHVFCNVFRNPGLLAKMLTTLDEFSHGRVILSLGGGWFKEEAVSYGYHWNEDHDVRLEQVREATHIIKALWTQDRVTFKGKHYSVENAYLEPKPYTKPHPPIWVPGESTPAREMVKAYGDVWLIYSKSPEMVARMKREMSEFCGREITLAISAVFVSDPAEEKALDYAKLFLKEREHRFPKTPTLEDIIRHNIIGSLEHCREKVEAYREAGVDHLIIQPMPPRERMELFATEIMPAFRKGAGNS